VIGLLVLGVTLVVLEARRAPPTPGATRRHRVAVYGLLGALMMVALSPSVLLLVEEHRLPVEPPAEPWHDPTTGCSGGGPGTGLVIAALILYVVVRASPAVAAMTVGARRSTRRVPTGRLALRVTTVGFALIAGLASARMAACGAPPSRFTPYGALTPAGADGWRVRAALFYALDGELQPIATAPMIEDEHRYVMSSHLGPPPPSARPGLHAWVGTEPVLFFVDEHQQVVGASVRERAATFIPPEGRPHFRDWPQVGRLDRAHYVIAGRGLDGGVLAIKVSTYDLSAESVSYGEVGLLVRPRPWRWLAGLLLGVAGLALGWHARRRDDAVWRLLAAWMLLEATAIALYSLLPYLGVRPG